MSLQKINRSILLPGFIIGNILWIKALYDIATANKIWPSFSFPSFFLPLFIAGAILSVILSVYCLKSIWPIKGKIEPLSNTFTQLIWLAIPLSVFCTSPVCYASTICFSPYLVSTIIRLGLIILSLFAWIIYLNDKKETAIIILLILSFLLLVPNDKCYNPFNYWWVNSIGASSLTYLPTMLVILFSITGLYGKNKYLILIIIYGLCLAALFIALGHRIKLLW